MVKGESIKGIEYANSMHRCCSLAVLDKLTLKLLFRIVGI